MHITAHHKLTVAFNIQSLIHKESKFYKVIREKALLNKPKCVTKLRLLGCSMNE